MKKITAVIVNLGSVVQRGLYSLSLGADVEINTRIADFAALGGRMGYLDGFSVSHFGVLPRLSGGRAAMKNQELLLG